ncbi:uncharacterized protein F5891DRAFT_981591 [Suillus fuscotomentosus]|uniref:Uncharacterized protein n=1 Tax=Suillus fuscotomentosus TaxID=1912939 RepID=A0AAD4HJA5_9AGAM|nr:uncharacterized protein F5891DRAFT_981591 [Suillus fuscotomentosus]KAG1898678.1 hypothetical protein F5891DRAFT_981591 [Suillus fuscotomentosus]
MIPYRLAQKMGFSLLAVVVALTASMSGNYAKQAIAAITWFVPLMEEIWSAGRGPSLLKMNPAAQAACRDNCGLATTDCETSFVPQMSLAALDALDNLSTDILEMYPGARTL